MNKIPLLSICVPTYNRGYILKDVLEKYCHNPSFDDDVELIISDNNSSDDTCDICRYFSSIKSNIRYYRNEENIRDKNFINVLNYGSGRYLKLMNDWAYYDEDSLAFVKHVIKENIDSNKPIFFTSDHLFTKRKAEIVNCDNLDDFVSTMSCFVTYNNLFGVWKDHWEKIQDKFKYSHLQLQQVDWFYQIVLNNSGCVIYNKKTFQGSLVKRKIKTGYNWFKVHLDYYYQIMQPYIDAGLITQKTYKKDRHYLLNHFKTEFCWVYFYNFTPDWRFETKGTTKLLLKYYRNDPYLLFFFLKLPFHYLYKIGATFYRGLRNK